MSLIANRGIHPIFNRGPLHGANTTAETLQKIVFELSPDKIYSLKSATNNATSEILSTLEFISMNIIPPKVKNFVRLCDPKRITYNSCTLDTFPADLREFKKKDKMSSAKACELLIDFANIKIICKYSLLPTDYMPSPLDRIFGHKDPILHIYKEFDEEEAKLAGLLKFNLTTRSSPYWIIPPNIIFIDGRHYIFFFTMNF